MPLLSRIGYQRAKAGVYTHGVINIDFEKVQSNVAIECSHIGVTHHPRDLCRAITYGPTMGEFLHERR